jgi:hypothetical protein
MIKLIFDRVKSILDAETWLFLQSFMSALEIYSRVPILPSLVPFRTSVFKATQDLETFIGLQICNR